MVSSDRRPGNKCSVAKFAIVHLGQIASYLQYLAGRVFALDCYNPL
jgi:hypothetical protein